MVKILWIKIFLTLGVCNILYSQNIISVHHLPLNRILIQIDHDYHVKFGFKYPITYLLRIPNDNQDLIAEKQYSDSTLWQKIPTKSSTELYNGIEAVRFDYQSGVAYVSASFDDQCDSLLIRINDVNKNAVPVDFKKVAQYYDDRKAVVTITADDWCDGLDKGFKMCLPLFRSRGLYVTCGIITDSTWSSKNTWASIQKQIDSSYIEIASHSRTHSFFPYNNFYSEVIGSWDDINTHLKLPEYSRNKNSQYIYVWISPRSTYGIEIDTLLPQRSYLIPRQVGSIDVYNDKYSKWDSILRHFQPTSTTLEIGKNSSGTGGIFDLTFLNAKFDSIKQDGGIYHMLWHPQDLVPYIDFPFVSNHLDYISRRQDIWYVNLGYLYLYHLIQSSYTSYDSNTLNSKENGNKINFRLDQNYPNPFNSSTTIRYHVPRAGKVTLKVYDVLGREKSILVDKYLNVGEYTDRWDAVSFSTGIYFYKLTSNNFSEVKKMVYIK